MRSLKHVGKMRTNGAKVLVVFRTLPGESDSALVVSTANLSDADHNAIIALVESDQAQDTNEFGEILGVRFFPDGRQMLKALHQDSKLAKVKTADVIMTPNPNSSVALDQLNVLIAEQKNCAVDDLAFMINSRKIEEKPSTTVENITESKDISPNTAKTTSASVNESVEPTTFDTPEAEAKFYRSQADKLSKQAAEMRRKAEELSPTKKKATTAEAVDA